MLIMQYEINLPADYDMHIIRRRVVDKGAAFDHFPGLGLKCFAIREKGRFGATTNEYAPIYLWPRTESMWPFLTGPAFRGVKDAFGPPSMHTWPSFVFARSPAMLNDDFSLIASVTRETLFVPRESDLAVLRSREIQAASDALASKDGPLIRAVGLDPHTGQLARFSFWRHSQAALPPDQHSYAILHVSAPEGDRLVDVPGEPDAILR